MPTIAGNTNTPSLELSVDYFLATCVEHQVLVYSGVPFDSANASFVKNFPIEHPCASYSSPLRLNSFSEFVDEIPVSQFITSERDELSSQMHSSLNLFDTVAYDLPLTITTVKWSPLGLSHSGCILGIIRSDYAIIFLKKSIDPFSTNLAPIFSPPALASSLIIQSTLPLLPTFHLPAASQCLAFSQVFVSTLRYSLVAVGGKGPFISIFQLFFDPSRDNYELRHVSNIPHLLQDFSIFSLSFSTFLSPLGLIYLTVIGTQGSVSVFSLTLNGILSSNIYSKSFESLLTVKTTLPLSLFDCVFDYDSSDQSIKLYQLKSNSQVVGVELSIVSNELVKETPIQSKLIEIGSRCLAVFDKKTLLSAGNVLSLLTVDDQSNLIESRVLMSLSGSCFGLILSASFSVLAFIYRQIQDYSEGKRHNLILTHEILKELSVESILTVDINHFDFWSNQLIKGPFDLIYSLELFRDSSKIEQNLYNLLVKFSDQILDFLPGISEPNQFKLEENFVGNIQHKISDLCWIYCLFSSINHKIIALNEELQNLYSNFSKLAFYLSRLFYSKSNIGTKISSYHSTTTCPFCCSPLSSQFSQSSSFPYQPTRTCTNGHVIDCCILTLFPIQFDRLLLHCSCCSGLFDSEFSWKFCLDFEFTFPFCFRCRQPLSYGP
ncbi:hypothetical protein RCL1_007044 [Eukaryota sp. TZLM3-RCL]